MEPNELAKIITDIIKAEKDTFKEYIENEDWGSMRDEIYECLTD